MPRRSFAAPAESTPGVDPGRALLSAHREARARWESRSSENETLAKGRYRRAGITPGQAALREPGSRSPSPPAERAGAELPVWILPLAVVVVVAIVHGSAMAGFFSGDDFDFLLRARHLDPAQWSWARPLPGVARWLLFTRWFGVDPRPHFALALLLHALSAWLLGLAVIGSGLGSRAGLAAALALAGSTIAYSSLHGASGLGEVMATAFSLAALVLQIHSVRSRDSLGKWMAGACVMGALLSKESVLLLPIAIWAWTRWVAPGPKPVGAFIGIFVCGGLGAVALVSAWGLAPHVAGEAYELQFSPAAWIANLITYAAWLLRIGDPIPDRDATVQPGLWPWGVTLLVIWLLLAYRERKLGSKPATAGLSWFLLLLAPVLPLARHSYLYYLLTPFVGACLAVAGGVSALSRKFAPRTVDLILAAAALLYVANASLQIHRRESLSVGTIVVDRISREAGLVRNAVSDLRHSHVSAGDSIVLVSPYPQRSVNATAGTVGSASTPLGPHSYIPLVAALREGRLIPLFIPGVVVLGIGDRLPQEWERARAFRYEGDGHLTEIGRGAGALDSLALGYIESGRWAEAEAALRRVLMLGQDGPEIRWNLGAALAHTGEDRESFAQADTLLRRWPQSSRAQLLRANAAVH
jgi:hypothetical protein